MTFSGRKIALVDFHDRGHHPVYLELFARVLAAGGGAISVVAPRFAPDEASELAFVAFRFAPRWSRLWRFRGRSHLESLERFLQLRGVLRGMEKTSGAGFDQIVFACVYAEDFRGHHLWRWIWPWRWSGLYLHPHIDGEGRLLAYSWMNDGRTQALAFFDESLAADFSAGSPARGLALPDIALEKKTGSAMADRIRLLARGRKIVMLSGYLGRKKGVLPFIRAASRLDERDYFFALVGHLNFPDFIDEEQTEIRRWGQSRENAFSHPCHIEGEEVLNGILSIADVIFAVYLDWPFSSNVLAKAAWLEIPVVVAKGHLMERRVEESGIGIAADVGKLEEICDAIELLATQSEHRPSPEAYARFRRGNSKENFALAIRRLAGATEGGE